MTHGLAKEFHKLLKNVDKISNGQARVSAWDDENMESFELEIKPTEGLYQGGTFMFKVLLEEDFPTSPPSIRCETLIYHPNIDPTEMIESNICVSMFDTAEWQESYGVDGILQGILFLFYEPNVEDPLSPYFGGAMDMDEFETNVAQSLKGGTVEGVQYEVNYVGKKGSDIEEVKDEKCDNTEVHNDTSENVSMGDNSPTTDNEIDEVIEKMPALCNTTDNKDAVVATDVVNNDNLESKPQMTSDTEQKGAVQTTDEINPLPHQPDIIPLSNEDCSSLPDVVSIATELQPQAQGAVPCRDVKTSDQKKLFSLRLLNVQRGDSSVFRFFRKLYDISTLFE